jgi:hypothetical protein
MQGAIKRAAHRVNAVDTLDCLLDLFWSHEAHGDMDPAND